MRVLSAPIKITKAKKNNSAKPVKQAVKLPYPDLLDPTKKIALIKKYEPYFETFFAASKTAGYLAAVVQTFFNDSAIYSYPQEDTVPKNAEKAEILFLDKAQSLSKQAEGIGKFESRMKITENNVILYTLPINLHFNINLPGPQNKDEKSRLVQYMRGLFPAFNAPTVWQFTPNTTPPISFPLGEEMTTGWRNFDSFQKMPLNEETNLSYMPNIDFKGDINESMNQASYYSLFGIVSLASINSYDKYSLGIEGNSPQSGPLQVPIASASINVRVQSQIRLPLEMALWMTLQADPNKFNPKVFHEFASEHMAALTGFSKVKPKDIPMQTMTLKDIHTANVAKSSEYGLNMKLRTNEDNLLINDQGKIWHVPEVNNTATYDDLQKNSFDAVTGELIPNHRIEGIKNLPILTDTINEIYSYTGPEGGLQFLNLSGSIPLDNVTISKYLLRSCENVFGVTDPNKVEYESAAADVNKNLFSLLDVLARDAYSQNVDIFSLDKANYYTFESMWRSICSGTTEPIYQVFTGKTEAANSTRKTVQSFIDACKNMLNYIEKQTRYGIGTLIEVKFWLLLFSKYATNPTKYLESYNRNLEINTPAEVNELPPSVDIPNMADGVSMLPHQIQATNQSQKGPELLILDFSPGGGKTITALADILVQKFHQRINAAIVVCPPTLVKEWCSEINKFTKGKVNAIPLTAKVIFKLRKRMGITRAQFLEYCLKAPPNTVFVTSMKFLTLKSDKFAPDNKSRFEVRYGKTIISQYPQVWFIKQLNPSYIVIDESQWSKNPKSQITNAIKQIASLTTYRRLASGTLVTNQGDDLIGQASVLNPAIYGNKKAFYDKYAITSGKSGDKFDGFKPGAEKIIREDAKPYVSWLTKRRADWSFLLPKINTEFWGVDLTTNQSEFYQNLLESAIEEIKKDKKIRQLLDESDPNMQDTLDAMMRPYLAKVEIFINAPDSETLAFGSLSTLEQEDLISPKLILAEKICKAHFEGGSVNGRRVEKSSAKIIIFGYNKEVIEHFKRHFNPGYKTVFYQSGDEDAVLKFRQDPSVLIMVAAETSLREGLNLQCADTLIRLQTLWSPGNQEQAVSRVMRPDVGNVFNREEINYFWFVCDHTMEIAKTCRLISKVISNLTISEGNNPEFQAFQRQYKPEDLPLIKMNILKEDSPIRYMTFEDLPLYSEAWTNYIGYEEKQFETRKTALRSMVAKRLVIPVEQVTDELIKKEAFTPIVSKSMIPNSRSIWVPLERGAIPHDPFKLDLKPIAVINSKTEEAENSEDEEEEEENEDKEVLIDHAPVKPGDLVYTEFGMGYIRAIMKNSAKIDVPGCSFSPITLNKTLVFKPMNKDNETKVLKMMKLQGKKGISFMNGFDSIPSITNPNSLKINTIEKTPSIKPTPVVKNTKIIQTAPSEEEHEDMYMKHINKGTDKLPGRTNQQYPLELGAGVFDGYAAVYLFTDQDHFKKAMKASIAAPRGQYPQFVYRHVRSWQGLKNLIAALENTFDFKEDQAEQLMNAGKKLYHRGQPRLLQRDPIEVNYRSFLNIANHKVSKNPNLIKLYPLIMNGELYVVGSIGNQPRQVQRFKKMQVSGVGSAMVHEPMTLFFFKTPQRAIYYIRGMKKKFKIAGANDALKVLKNTPSNFYRA